MLAVLIVLLILAWCVLLVALSHEEMRPHTSFSHTGFCKDCGYDVRGLTRDDAGCGMCPECGLIFDIHALKVRSGQQLPRDRTRRGLAIVLAIACALSHVFIDIVWFVCSLFEGRRLDLIIELLKMSLAKSWFEHRFWMALATIIFMCTCFCKTAKFDTSRLNGSQLIRLTRRCFLLWVLALSVWTVVMYRMYHLWWWTDQPLGDHVPFDGQILLLCLFAIPAGLAARWLFGRAARSKPPTVPSADEQ